jgi:5S rRNA maturation endonuclease (ribonuclease M5)
MSRSYIFCEGKRDRRFLKRLIQEKKKGTTVREIEPRDLDNLLRYKHFEGVALVECGGFITMLQNAAR